MRVNPSVVFTKTGILILAGFDEIAALPAKFEVFGRGTI
jgi:hypothetical protein